MRKAGQEGEEGATQQALETANKMLDKGYNINEVAELTGLSLAQLSFHLGQNT
ncbi:MAG: hypothetical protein R3E08_04385 [Thiotrichaceae bacterium]